MHSEHPANTAKSIRTSGFFGILMGLTIGPFSLYWLITHVLPIYPDLMARASVIEVPYLAFGLFVNLPLMFFCVVGGGIALYTGRRFDPPRGTALKRFAQITLTSSLWALIGVAPLLAAGTTLTLKALDYSMCPALRQSGSAWQTYWVSDAKHCIAPDGRTP